MPWGFRPCLCLCLLWCCLRCRWEFWDWKRSECGCGGGIGSGSGNGNTFLAADVRLWGLGLFHCWLSYCWSVFSLRYWPGGWAIKVRECYHRYRKFVCGQLAEWAGTVGWHWVRLVFGGIRQDGNEDEQRMLCGLPVESFAEGWPKSV